MPAAKRLIAVSLVILAAFVGGWALLRPAPEPPHLSGAQARPIAGQPGAVGVFLTIDVADTPETLLDVRAESATAVIASPNNDPIALPAGSTPSLAADGVHILLKDLDSAISDGQLIPITLDFENSGTQTVRARFADTLTPGAAASVGLFGLGDICIVDEGEPAPQIALSVTPNGLGWQVEIESEEFTFTRKEDSQHVLGEGHGHLYLNGLKLARLYESTARIGALPSGTHEIGVTLSTNDHRAYVVDGEPVMATVHVVAD